MILSGLRFLWHWLDIYMLVSYLHYHLPYHNTDAYILRYRLIKRQEDADTSRITNRLTTILYLSVILLRMMTFYTQSVNNAEENSQATDPHENSLETTPGTNSIPYPKKLPVGAGCLIPCENRCAICREPWIDPCASTGGYIFCYSCLVDYVQMYRRCPVTGSYCGINDIIRVFLKD